MTRHVVDLHELEGHNQLFGIECDYTRGWQDGFDAAVHAVRISPEAADLPVEPRSGSEGTATADEPPRRYRVVPSAWIRQCPWPAPVPGTHESDLWKVLAPEAFDPPRTNPRGMPAGGTAEYLRAAAWSRSNRKEPQP